MAAADYVTVVQQLYVAYFGRPADVTGLANFTAALDATGVPATIEGVKQAYGTDATVKALVDQFGTSTESNTLYGSGTTESFVFAVYQNVLNRVPDAAGFDFWVNALNNGGLSKGNAALSIMAGALANTSTQGQADAALINARITVATNFTTAITTQNATYSGDAAAATARAMLATVTASTDTTAFQSTIVSTLATITNPDAGSTFTLTTSATADVFTGTAKNDTFTGASGTVANGDMLIDSSTTDSDTANLTITAAYTPANIANVENVNITWNAFGTATVDAANITGASTITVSSSKLGYLGNVQIDNAGNHKVVAGTGAVGTLDVNGGKAVTVDGGASKIITVDGTATAASNVSATVTAGAATTTVTVGAANGFATTNVTGGAKTTAINVTGGAGTTDVANVTVVADGTVTVGTGSKIETLNITAGAGNKVTIGDASAFDKASVTSTGAVTLVAGSDELTTRTLTNSTTGLTIDLTSDAAADLSKVQFTTLNLKNNLAGDLTVTSGSVINVGVLQDGTGEILTGTGTADTLTLNVSIDQTKLDLDHATDSAETVTINTSIGATDADSILTIGQLDAKAAVLTGASKVTVTTFNATSLDASAVTAAFVTKQGTAAAATVVGSATASNTVEFTATTQTTSYTGGEGADTIKLAQTTGNSTTVLGNGTNSYTNTSLTDGTAVVLGGTGVDTVTVTATDSGANTANVAIQTGDGADVVTLSLAGANETAAVDLGAGDDSFKIGNATSASDVLALEGGDGTDTFDLNGKDLTDGTITLSNVEVLWDSTGGAKVDGALIKSQTFTIKGDGNIATLLDVDLDTAGTYDFSGLVLDATLTKGIGGLNIAGNAGNDTITGTSGNDTIASGGGTDTITGGAGVDTMTAGGGTDTFVIASGHAGTSAATIDHIVSFTSGTDKIKTGLAASLTNYVEVADADYGDDYSAVLAAANTALNGTVLFAFVGDTDAADAGAAVPTGYLFWDIDADGTADYGVELVGKQAATFAMGDIIA